MKKLLSLLTLLVCLMLTSMTVNAQNVTVNPGAGSYPTLKDAFDAINAGTHTGALTVNVINNTTESAPAVLNSSGIGSANYTSVIIRPTGDNIIVTGASATGRGIVELNGADNVTIDGDNLGSVGVNRNLTFQNTAANTVTFTSVIRIATSASISTADNITIANCNIAGSGTGRNTSTFTSEVATWGIVASINAGTPPTALTSAASTIAAGQTVANLIINNNNIVTVSRGVSCGGAATTVFSGLAISNNIVGSPTEGGVDQVTQNGITISGSANAVISGNTVYVESYSTTNSAIRGIEVGVLSTITTTVSIQRNVVARVKNNNAASWGAYGINLGGGNGHVVVNNALLNHSNSQVAGTSAFSTTFGVMGIRVGAGTTHSVLHNSVHFAGILPGATSTDLVACLAIVGTGQTGCDVRNNILSNVMTGGNPTLYNTVFVSLYLPGAGTSAMNLTLNNNAYYQSASAQSGIAQVSTTGSAANLYLSSNFNSGAITPSTNLRAYTSVLSVAGTNDNGSFAINTPAPFTSATNLHIPFATPGPLESGGAFTSVTTDIDGNVRPGPAGSVNGGAFAPDIGYDEFDGIPGGDITPPVISYTLLTNTASTSNRAFTNVTVTDAASGVNGAPGTRPRVYYKRTSDANTFNSNVSGTDGWKYAEATGATSPFDFTIDYSRLFGGTGVTTFDIVQYFVVAQDLATIPNVGINSGTFAATPTSVNLTSAAFPIGGTINSYSITGPPLAGDYTVGVALFNQITGKNITFERVITKVRKEVSVSTSNRTAKDRIAEVSSSVTDGDATAMVDVEEVSFVPMQNGQRYTGSMLASRSEYPNMPLDAGVGVFASITEAVSAINLNGSSAAVRFLLLDPSYTAETLPIVINYSTASSTNTLTIRPQTSVVTSISGAASAGVVFKILSSYVTIDGSNSNGTDRSMTLTNTSITTPSVVWIGSTGTTPITNVSLKNCIVYNGVNTSTAVVTSDGAVLGSAGYFNNIDLRNNDVRRAYMAFYNIAVVTAGNGSGLTLANNTINTIGADAVRYTGIYVQGVDGATVSGNDIGNFETTSSETDKGVWFATGTVNSNAHTNTIHDLRYTGTAGYAGRGFSMSPGVVASNNRVYNNMLYNFTGDGDAYGSFGMTFSPTAIHIFGAGTGGVACYYNSIYMYGNTINFSATAYSAGVSIDDGAFGTVVDNIIYNNLGRLGTVGAGTVGIAVELAGSFPTSVSNYNDILCAATGGGTNNVGKIAGTDYVTLGNWQAGSSQDANSISADPLYVSLTDLHISGGSPCTAAGTPVVGITTDFDGNTRNATNPTIGADEVATSSTLNLTVKMEGYTLMDTITVELRNSTSPYALVESVKGMGGLATSQPITFTAASDGTPYAIVVKYRNGIATWSSGNVTFAGGVASYNFTTAISQAFGNNQKLVSGQASIYQGDVNQSGGVNLADITSIYNAATAFTSGYNVNNLINNATVNLASITIAFNNASAFVVVKPRP